MTCYQHLYAEYPPIISMEQLYKICHISKRKAKWMLEQGIIPCSDTQKKTRRFKIMLKDVIEYLHKNDLGLLETEVPVGIWSSKEPLIPAYPLLLDKDGFLLFLKECWDVAPDLLTIKDVALLTGYSSSAIQSWVQKDFLVSIVYHRRLMVCKDSLAEFIAEKNNYHIAAKSEKHKELIESFWRKRKAHHKM